MPSASRARWCTPWPSARPLPLLASFALVLATNIGFALGLAGSIRRRLPFWPNLKLQTAGVFSNLALPFGSQALQVRFLQKQGVDGATAVAAGGIINLAAGTVTQLVLFFVALEASPRTIDLGQIPTGTITTVLIVATAGILLASLVVLAVPALRRKVAAADQPGRPQHRRGAAQPSPDRLAARAVSASPTPSTACPCTRPCAAFGVHASVWSLIAVNLGVTLVAALVPFPGGGTAVGSVGLSGALVALGIPETEAVGAVLVYQVISQYLPALPGWLALRSLVAHDEL